MSGEQRRAMETFMTRRSKEPDREAHVGGVVVQRQRSPTVMRRWTAEVKPPHPQPACLLRRIFA
eukprot:805185-Amphidinium_carterae.1